jgi:thiol-disulfide isomerase/thioredoxin
MRTRFSPNVTPFLVLLALASPIASAKAAPVNDYFASRSVISSTNGSGLAITNIVITADNIGAGCEPAEPLHAGVTGGAAVWWTWKAPKEGTVTISTTGSLNELGDSLDTALAVYTGNTLTNLMEEASNDDRDYSHQILTSQVVFDVVADQTYQIAVDGWNGASGSIRLSLQLKPLAPRIVAPSWALADPHGGTIFSTNFAGKVVILDFWASWAGRCKTEMADLIALQNKYRSAGLVVVGANASWSGDTAQMVNSSLATNVPVVNYQMVMSTAALEKAYGGVDAVPTTFIIDRDNFIRKKIVWTQTAATLEHAILPLLFENVHLESLYTANSLILLWPTNGPFRLQTTANLSGTWSNWTGKVLSSGNANIVTVDVTGPPRFFRLQVN